MPCAQSRKLIGSMQAHSACHTTQHMLQCRGSGSARGPWGGLAGGARGAAARGRENAKLLQSGGGGMEYGSLNIPAISRWIPLPRSHM